MVKVLSVVTWLSISRPGLLRTRFLFLLTAIGVNNIDITRVKSVTEGGVEDVMGDIAE